MVVSLEDVAASLRNAIVERRSWLRLVLALYIGTATARLAWYPLSVPDFRDFSLFWWSAKALLKGVDPYSAIGPTGSFYTWPYPQTYPITGLLPIAPLTLFPPPLAATLFSAGSAAILAFLLSRDGYARLAVFLSWGFFYAVNTGQWSPLLTAAALLPPLGFLLIAKPTIGLALFAFRPTLTAATGCLLLLALSLAVQPTWPADWLANVGAARGHFRIPLFVPGGQLLLLAALRWKRPEARLLLALACIPHSMLPYETVLLFLLVSTAAEGITLASLSWIWMMVRASTASGETLEARYDAHALWMVLLMYLPALVMVLRRSNEGDSPALLRSLSRWIRSPLRAWRPAESRAAARSPAVASSPYAR